MVQIDPYYVSELVETSRGEVGQAVVAQVGIPNTELSEQVRVELFETVILQIDDLGLLYG